MLQLFKFMILILKGCIPFFYNLLLQPLITSHNYGTRAGAFRHPLISCEVERRSIASQLILMHEEINADVYVNLSIAGAICKYKRSLLSRQ